MLTSNVQIGGLLGPESIPVLTDSSGLWTATPVPVETPTQVPASTGTVTATTAGPTVTSGISGSNDAVPMNGNLFSSLSQILSPATPATSSTATMSQGSGSMTLILIALALGAGYYFFLR